MRPPFASLSLTPLADFVSQLWETGEVQVPDWEQHEISAADREQTWIRLSRYAQEESQSLSGPPPALIRSAAEWGAMQFARACSFLIHRSHSAEEMAAALAVPCPEDQSPGTCYSVDLTFRYLPDLYRLSQQISPSDRLCQVLVTWGQEWLLSSVGLEFGNPSTSPEPAETNPDLSDRPESSWQVEQMRPRLSSCWEDPCLRRLYVDRVLETGDRGRLRDERVACAVREVLGYHHELSVKMAAALPKLEPLTEATPDHGMKSDGRPPQGPIPQ